MFCVYLSSMQPLLVKFHIGIVVAETQSLNILQDLAIDNLDYIFTVGAPSIINHRSYAKLLAIYSFIYYLYQIRAINISPPSLFIHFFGYIQLCTKCSFDI